MDTLRFMNDYDIDRAARRYAGHPVAYAAVCQVKILANWANANSDGWAYWPKPCRAAAKMMELIEGNGTSEAIRTIDERATVANYKKALAPIKAFRTRQGADFPIVEVTA